MAEYLIVLAVAAVVTWLLTPTVRRVAIRLGAVVSPDNRRVHERPTPTLGGAAMYGGFLAAMAAMMLIYLVLIELGKRRFYRDRAHGPPIARPRPDRERRGF